MRKQRRVQRGATLLEVLVSLIVLSIGILGLASLQLNALKANQLALSRTTASQLAYQITDVMRANRTLALSGSYDIALANSAPNGNGIPAQDLRLWKEQLGALPAGDGAISHSNAKVTVTIQWNESRIKGGSNQQFIYVTEL